MKVAVIGLGAIGSQVLWQLSKRADIEVHGYETRYPGHGSAGAGGETRLYRNLELSDLGYLPIIRRADEVWRELEQESGRELRRLDGVLLVGNADAPQIRTALESASLLDKPYEVLTREMLANRFPHISTFTGDVGVWDSHAGVIAPETTVLAASELAARNGAVVHRFAEVESVESFGSKVRVATADSSEEYDRVVVAAGGWTTKLLPELRGEMVTRRLTSAWFLGRTPETLQGMPSFMRTAPSYCYGIPTFDGRMMKLGLGFNDHYVTGDPDTVPRELSADDVREQIQRFAWVLQDLLPELDPHPVRISTFIESYTRSMHEYIRPLPSDSNITVLGGFSGHGFKMCPAIGEIGADLAVGDAPSIDIDFLAAAPAVFDIEDPSTGATTFNAVMSSNAR